MQVVDAKRCEGDQPMGDRLDRHFELRLTFAIADFDYAFLIATFALRTSLAQKLMEFLELGWRDELKDHSVSLANDYELVAFVESCAQIAANLGCSAPGNRKIIIPLVLL